MSLEEWVEANQIRDQWSDLVVPVIELREFLKGKVLVDLNFLLYAKCSGSEQLHNFRECGWCKQMIELQKALSPNHNRN